MSRAERLLSALLDPLALRRGCLLLPSRDWQSIELELTDDAFLCCEATDLCSKYGCYILSQQ